MFDEKMPAELVFLNSAELDTHPMYIVYEDGTIYSRYMKQFLDPSLNRDGYYVSSLYENGLASRVLLHRLVAKCFIPNSDPKKRCVNHKDLDKTNNRVENLEWVTSKENAQHAMNNGANPCRKQPVHQFTANGKFIASYKTITEASNATGISRPCISKAISGASLLSRGFYWSKEKVYRKRYSRSCKPVNQICPKSGKILATFPNADEAQTALGKNGKIGEVCNGRRKSACGFGWEYAKLEQENIEEWKDWAVLSEYPSYKISKDGRVYSKFFNRILDIKPRSGYLKTELTTKDGKRKHVAVHRLVASAYIPNPKKYPVVNHLDENGLNNNVANLEWTTSKGNSIHSAHKQKKTRKKTGHTLNVDKPNQKKVGKYDTEGNFIEEYKSIASAARSIGKYPSGISEILRGGKQKTSGGFIWKYIN